MWHNAHKRSIPALAVLAVGTLALTSCGGDNGDSAEGDGEASGEELSITFLPKNLGNPYFETSNAGGQEAIEEFGGSYSVGAPGGNA